MTRKVCVVTGSRAEYGLLRWVLDGIRNSPILELQLAVTGMHLSPQFGSTYKEIEADGFRIEARVDTGLGSDTSAGIARSMGLGLSGFGEVFERLRPDIVLLLGDRFEIFAAAAAASVSRVPVAHLHGGEITEGAFDDMLRHAISKMSHLHFVAAEEYRKRVIQLGEQPDRVFLVGGLGVDQISKLQLFSRAELEDALDFRLGVRNLLVTYHPVTLDKSLSAAHMVELLSALDSLENTHLIFTMPNADPESNGLRQLVEEFVASHDNARAFASLGQLKYLSCVRHVDGVIGNSSSGLTEVPSMRRGTVNIGDRQRGRLKATSVIDCEPLRESIGAAVQKLYSAEFRSLLETVENPYGQPGASDKIVRVLETVSLDSILKKSFHNVTIDS